MTYHQLETWLLSLSLAITILAVLVVSRGYIATGWRCAYAVVAWLAWTLVFVALAENAPVHNEWD